MKFEIGSVFLNETKFLRTKRFSRKKVSLRKKRTMDWSNWISQRNENYCSYKRTKNERFKIVQTKSKKKIAILLKEWFLDQHLKNDGFFLNKQFFRTNFWKNYRFLTLQTILQNERFYWMINFTKRTILLNHRSLRKQTK